MGGLSGWRVAVALNLALLSAQAARAARIPCPEVPTMGAPERPAVPCPGVSTGGTPRYAGHVAYYVADLKPSFPQNASYSAKSALTQGNYCAVLHGLTTYARVNGVRMPIFPAKNAKHYSPLYHAVFDEARRLGLLIYANPSAVKWTSFQYWGKERYVAWLVDYARKFRPDVLSPFNEAGRSDGDMIAIAKAVRAALAADERTAHVQLMGPDNEHVDYSLNSLTKKDPEHPNQQGPDLVRSFDMIGSHNAGSDEGDNADEWMQLVAAAEQRPAWSSENPAPWRRVNQKGVQLGIDQAVQGGVSGIVSWMAKPGLVDDAGNPTSKACEIAAGLVR